MPVILLAVLLPSLYWDRPADTAGALHNAGIERLYVPASQVKAWSVLGFTAAPFDRAGAAQAVPPKVEYRIDVASATRVPWVDANGWQFERDPHRAYFYDVPAGSASLAAAEAFSSGVDAAIRAVPEDLRVFARMLQFLARIDQPRLPVKANIGVVDDGSEELGEVLNLMARHNLLFHVIPAADPRYDLNIRLGTAEYPKAEAADPYAFAMKIRRRLTDEKRLLRIYGSDVVLGRLTGAGTQARLHLLNYGRRSVRGLRIRVLGAYARGKLAAFENESAELADYAVRDGATEFSIPEMGAYAIVDLSDGAVTAPRP